jgi:hypothetical protein
MFKRKRHTGTQPDGSWNGYCVTSGLRGYLPNTVQYCETLQEAREFAVAMKHDWESDGETRLSGNLRRDWQYTSERDEVITIDECTLSAAEYAHWQAFGDA